MKDTMKAIVIEKFGGVDQLKLKEVAVPQPLENEILIQIKYTSVNPVDWKIREGYLKDRLPHEFPIILGWDAAGTVAALGKHVKNRKVGEEVYAYCRKSIVCLGTYAEYVTIDADHASLKPKSLSFAQAAAVPLAGLTAWQSLFNVGRLAKGETVLIHAGAGGVGSFALTFAKYAGARVLTTASKKNHAYVKKQGADVAIDYKEENVEEKVKEITGDGVDLVFDTVGGKTYSESFKLLRPGGRIVSILEQVNYELADKYQVRGEYVFVSPSGSELKQIADLFDQGKIIMPKIEEMLLSEAAKAQEKIRTGHTSGKIVLKYDL